MKFGTAIGLLPLFASPSLAGLKVMASFRPVHSLVASVMEGTGSTPGLIIQSSSSPHTYALKPSDAEALQSAQIIFWIGPGLETFLEKPIEILGAKATSVTLAHASNVTHLPRRSGAGFDPHVHHNEDENEKEIETSHAHEVNESGGHEGDKVDGHDHIKENGEPAKEADTHAHEDEQGHDESDPHVWLDPENAVAMVKEIASALAKADPGNAAKYETNAEMTVKRIGILERELQLNLAPLSKLGFVTFHDATQYFERRFGLRSSGAIALNPENPPGAEGIKKLQKRVRDGNVTCILAEPQFDNKLVKVIAEGSNAKIGIIDPEGSTQEPGPMMYEELLRGIARSLMECAR